MTKNPKRTLDDIKDYTVYMDYPGVDGWVVLIRYHDEKQIMYSIDPPKEKLKSSELLQLVSGQY